MVTAYWLLVAAIAAITFGLWWLYRDRMGLGTCAAWVLIALGHGLIFKPLFVLFEYPNRELLELTLLQNITISEYWVGSIVVLIPYVIFVAFMFAAGPYGYRRHYTVRKNGKVFFFSEFALAGVLLAAFLGAIGFFLKFPQLLADGNKNIIATSDISEYSGGGVWRAIAELSYVVSLCALVNVGLGRHRRRNVLLLTLAAMLWLAFCYASDQRGAMAFAVATYMIAYARFVAPISRLTVVVLFGAVLALVVGKTVMRLQVDDAPWTTQLAAVAANFNGQNFVENGKTISIIKAVPDRLEFQFGKSFVDAILILVPRALYPQKTTVNLDTTVGREVFNCDVFGACAVPPGLVAESYLNFGVVGVAFLSAVVGIAVGLIDRRFLVARPGNISDLYYVYALVFIGIAVLGSGISSFITQMILQMVLLLFVVCASGRRSVRIARETRHRTPVD